MITCTVQLIDTASPSRALAIPSAGIAFVRIIIINHNREKTKQQGISLSTTVSQEEETVMQTAPKTTTTQIPEKQQHQQ